MSPAAILAALAVASFVAVVAAAPSLIKLLTSLAYRQAAYEDAPKSHASKSGTPTMGGLLFVIPLVLALALTGGEPVTRAVCILALACGAIGAIDDLAKVRGLRTRGNRGLRGPLKFALTGAAAIVFLALLEIAGKPDHDILFVPFLQIFRGSPTIVVAHWLWLALSLAVVLGTTHAVNLTDGLDGLAVGAIVPPLLALILLAYAGGSVNGASAAAATAGGALGFLVYNRFPARVFMGDTGALALGGVLAGTAIVTGGQLLLPLAGGVFVAETVSVIVQVVSFRTTRKRVFRMSPLHHHYELCGWPETKVTHRFWAASVALSLLSVLSLTWKSA